MQKLITQEDNKMMRERIIKTIFNQIPKTYKGIDGNGDHVIQITRNSMLTFATLERLSDPVLFTLANEYHRLEIPQASSSVHVFI